MKFTLFTIGKTDIPYIKQGIDGYLQRIVHFVDFSIIELPQIRHTKSLSPELLCKKEGESLANALRNCNLIILLDENGKEHTSRSFSEYLNKIMNKHLHHVAFVTGGAYGFSDSVYKMAHDKLSLSRMTFTHQMVRLIFMEQFYRAFTVIRGIPYHND